MAAYSNQVTQLEAWTVLESHMALDERWCRIRRDKIRFPDGRVCDDYFLALRPDVAVVFALSSAGAVPFVRQYKHGAGEITLELPAGTFDSDDAVAAARRELAEETGWRSDEFTCIAEFFDDASKNTNRVYCVVALGATKSSDQMLDANELSSGVEVVEIDVTEVEKLLASGRVKAQSSVAAAYQALSWLRDRGVL
jgi:ADP-ribose pyrophosphatase